MIIIGAFFDSLPPFTSSNEAERLTAYLGEGQWRERDSTDEHFLKHYERGDENLLQGYI